MKSEWLKIASRDLPLLHLVGKNDAHAEPPLSGHNPIGNAMMLTPINGRTPAILLPLTKIGGIEPVFSAVCTGSGGGDAFVGDVGDPGDCADCYQAALPADCSLYDKSVDQLNPCQLNSCDVGDYGYGNGGNGGGGGGDVCSSRDNCGADADPVY